MKLDDIRLYVYIISETSGVEACLRSCLPVSGFDVSVESLRSCSEIRYESDHVIVIISDSKDELAKAKKIEDECYRLYPVLIVNGEPLEEIPEGAADLWPERECSASRQFRFRKLLKFIETEIQRWLCSTYLHTVIDNIPELVWVKDVKGAHILVNRAFARTVHKEREDIEGRGHFYIWDITPEEYSTGEFVCMESEEEVMKNKRTMIFEEPVKTKDGMMHLITYKTPVFDRHNEVLGTVGVAHNVSDFSNMGIQLSLLIENFPIPLLICTNNWDVLQINSYFRTLFGIDGQDQANFDYKAWKMKTFTLISKNDPEREEDPSGQECTAVIGDAVHTFIVIEREIRDYFFNVSGYFVLLQDVTLERNYEKKILQAANTDSLTGLNNRRYFYQFMKKRNGQALTLLYMDLDHFKEINDLFGHDRGDDVLRRTANMIKDIFPQGTAFRLGGDEFALVLDGIYSEAELQDQCDKLYSAIKNMFRKDESRLSISIGITSTEGGCMDIDDFIKSGDSKMYVEKQKHHMKSSDADKKG